MAMTSISWPDHHPKLQPKIDLNSEPRHSPKLYSGKTRTSSAARTHPADTTLRLRYRAPPAHFVQPDHCERRSEMVNEPKYVWTMNKIRVVRAYTIYVRVKVGFLLGRLGFRLCVVWIYSARAKFVRCVFDEICAVHVHILFMHPSQNSQPYTITTANHRYRFALWCRALDHTLFIKKK